MLTKNDELLAEVLQDFNTASITDEDKAMLRFAAKLTRSPESMCEEDVKELKDLGFSDRAIFDLTQVVAYFNYVNRIADGLGVELEESYQKKDE